MRRKEVKREKKGREEKKAAERKRERERTKEGKVNKFFTKIKKEINHSYTLLIIHLRTYRTHQVLSTTVDRE